MTSSVSWTWPMTASMRSKDKPPPMSVAYYTVFCRFVSSLSNFAVNFRQRVTENTIRPELEEINFVTDCCYVN